MTCISSVHLSHTSSQLSNSISRTRFHHTHIVFHTFAYKNTLILQPGPINYSCAGGAKDVTSSFHQVSNSERKYSASNL